MTTKSRYNHAMKLKVHPNLKNGERPARGVTNLTEQANHHARDSKAVLAKRFRRLASDEMVVRGDFVADGHQGFELWEGPTGFRADSFLKPMYRPHENRIRANHTKR
jgi:hypothetical protein